MRTTLMPFVRAAAGLALALAALPTLAAEGRIPIPFTSPVITPINITAPGKYILTRPLKATAAGPVINIAVNVGTGVSEVDIDLNGFTIDASPFAGAIAIRGSSIAPSTAEISIRNGALSGGMNGINLAAAGAAALRKVVVEGVRISGTQSDAIVLTDAQNIVIRNNVIVDAGVGFAGPAAGILIPVGGAVVKQATIEGNLIRNTKDGIDVLSSSAGPATVAILNNRLEQIAAGGTSGNGIELQNNLGCLVMENTIREVLGGTGIRLFNTDGSKLFDNVINRTSGNGIFLDTASDDSLILRNVVSQATGSGLHVSGDRNQIESNLLTSNGRGLTIDVGAGALNNLYRSNTARGNSGAAFCPAAPCSVDFCGFAIASNQTQGDNWMPALAAAPPACEK